MSAKTCPEVFVHLLAISHLRRRLLIYQNLIGNTAAKHNVMRAAKHNVMRAARHTVMRAAQQNVMKAAQHKVMRAAQHDV